MKGCKYHTICIFVQDNIVIHSLDLGVSAPRITEARMVPDLNDPNGFVCPVGLVLDFPSNRRAIQGGRMQLELH